MQCFQVDKTPPHFHPDYEKVWIGCILPLAPEDALCSCPIEELGTVTHNCIIDINDIGEYHIVLLTDAIKVLKENHEPVAADYYRILLIAGIYLAFYKSVCSLVESPN